MKVIDKRMFTADGELRKSSVNLESSADYENLPEVAPSAEISDRPEEAELPPNTVANDTHQAAASSPEPDQGQPQGMAWDGLHLESGQGSPGFLDLVALLAEPTALYLGDVPMPDGKSAQDLSLARFHIDLLEVVRQKSSGNLTAEETTLLSDLLYRLRMRYVQKKDSA